MNRTGLTGRYNFSLTWAPDRLPTSDPLRPPGDELPPIDPDAPALRTALEEQLGLKVESTSGPVEILVIESIERPTPN